MADRKTVQPQFKSEGADVPPQNIEAEQAVLGSLLIDKDAIVKVADILRSEDFYQEKHEIIYKAMLDVYEARDPIDLVTLTARLEKAKQIESIGGASYLSELLSIVPTASHVASYAKVVQEKATLRRLIKAASDIMALGYRENQSLTDLLDRAEQNLFSVSQKYLKEKFIPLKDVLTDAFDRIDLLHKDKSQMRGVPTGFKGLDRRLAGLQPSDLVIIAARPSMGKSSLALNIAQHVATEEKTSVGFFSLEMSKEQLVDRMLCAEAGIDLWKLRTGSLDDDDFPKLGHAMGVLSDAPLYIDDAANANVMEIRTKARRLQAEHGLGLIIVDYLQLMAGTNGGGGSDNRVQEVSEISRGLKGIARELDIPVIALSQLSRAVEQRQPHIPQLADLRESGSIEQDADVVMFVYREEMYEPDTDRKNIADIFIKKHRNGPTGQIELFFHADQTKFSDLETDRTERTKE
ncbi:replicative DNA helicase [Patescibacteria group bacterium]|nr:MAG: replicative DNA helicase [Patescibacteria group bacterium]